MQLRLQNCDMHDSLLQLYQLHNITKLLQTFFLSIYCTVNNVSEPQDHFPCMYGGAVLVPVRSAITSTFYPFKMSHVTGSGKGNFATTEYTRIIFKKLQRTIVSLVDGPENLIHQGKQV